MSTIQWQNFYGTVVYPQIPNVLLQQGYIKCEDRVFYTDVPSNGGDETNNRITKVCRAICTFLKSVRNGYLVFHDLCGEKCTFTSETHWHIVTEIPHRDNKNRGKDNGIWSVNFFQELRERCKDNMFGIKSQKINYIENMTGYLKQPPRQFVGSTSIAMDRHWADTQMKDAGKKSPGGKKRRMEDEEDEEAPTPKRQRGENNGSFNKPRPGDRIKRLMELMRKYRKCAVDQMIRRAAIEGNDEDYDELLDFYASPSCKLWVAAARKLMCNGEPRTYAELFMEETTLDNIGQYLDINKFLSPTESHELYKLWAKEKRGSIKSGTYFLTCLYAVLFKKVPKRNTFMCYGSASSGKTFWTDPALWLDQYVGLSANDSHFCFAELAHSKVALINELRFNRDTLDIYKQLGEGKDCMVPVKNQGMGEANSQPIIITVNTEPWAACPEGREAMDERSFMFHFQSKSKCLGEHKVKNVNKGINPFWLKGVFTVLSECLADVNIPDLLENKDFSKPIWRHLDASLDMYETECYPVPDDEYTVSSSSSSEEDEWNDDSAVLAELNSQLSMPVVYEVSQIPTGSVEPSLEVVHVTTPEVITLPEENVIMCSDCGNFGHMTCKDSELCDKCGMLGECACVTSTEAEVKCEFCGYPGYCNGGASCQLYGQYRWELDEILGIIESDEKEAEGELMEITHL